MNPDALALITKERICVLSVVLPDGTPHSAVLHYSHTSDPLIFVMQTYPTVKTETIQALGGTAKASMVIGLTEAAFVELQMRGTVRMTTDPDEIERLSRAHYTKHPGAEKYKDEDTIYLEFTPTWWRYTDFNTSPETIVESKTP